MSWRSRPRKGSSLGMSRERQVECTGSSRGGRGAPQGVESGGRLGHWTPRPSVQRDGGEGPGQLPQDPAAVCG